MSLNPLAAVRRIAEPFRGGVDADRALMASMAGYIELSQTRSSFDRGAQWTPGQPLRLLLAGYNGTRNTGADVRVEEIIRQFRHLLGDDHLSLSLLTIDPELSRDLFPTARQLHLPQLFPRFLYDAVHAHHGVVACEGSMFKSKFANALSTMMAGSLGLATAEDKLAIGYGGEAGQMDPPLESFVRTYCRNAQVMTRNEDSRARLAELGLQASGGTDTAWTFDIGSTLPGQRLLQDAGWDGSQPILAICPINPFWWPVRPDVMRGLLQALGADSPAHYASVYFHRDSPEVHERQTRYLEALAHASRAYAERHRAFVVTVGMERLDRKACEAFAEHFGNHTPLFVSDNHNIYEMVGVLRQASVVLSSRYHALVTSMPALVPAVGVTMDERIDNLLRDAGLPNLVLRVDDEDLEERVVDALEYATGQRESVQEQLGRSVAANLRRQGEMGCALVDYIRSRHPDFPFRSGLGGRQSAWSHLPPLAPALQRLVERYGGHDGLH